MTSLPSSGSELLSPAAPARGSDLEFVRHGFNETPPRLIDYQWAWDEQRRIHAEVADGRRPGTVMLLEHADVYTAGRRTEPAERPQDGTPVVDVDRGGKITWHGPGQLVGYPIVTLPSGVYVVDYVRRLEEALIRTVSSYGLPAMRVQGRSGVWLPSTRDRPERKVVAIGIRVSRKTTQHGFALNVSPDLAAFDRIIPCGIVDAGVTSLAAELGEAPPMNEVADSAERHLREVLSFG